jgi:hypothetical protein
MDKVSWYHSDSRTKRMQQKEQLAAERALQPGERKVFLPGKVKQVQPV